MLQYTHLNFSTIHTTLHLHSICLCSISFSCLRSFSFSFFSVCFFFFDYSHFCCLLFFAPTHHLYSAATLLLVCVCVCVISFARIAIPRANALNYILCFHLRRYISTIFISLSVCVHSVLFGFCSFLFAVHTQT